MANPLHYQVTSDDQGKPLLTFLRGQGYSKKLLRRLKREGLTVNGAFHRLIDPVQAGDEVVVQPPQCFSRLRPNCSLQVPVCYEDEYLVVYDKPANMLVHPANKNFDDALANLFLAAYPGYTFRPLGRLDRDTTGLCLAAKDCHCAHMLQQGIDKTYFALVQGRLPQDQGVIDLPLLRIPGPKIRYHVSQQGLWAVTQYRVLQRTPQYTFVEIHLLTGRTHQIRAHFAALGYPLAGDALYGGSASAIQRQALHCGRMEFYHPVHKQLITVEASLPEDMKRLLQN